MTPPITNPIPKKTIERLSEYRRSLLSCHEQGITHVFSHILAGMHGITAVQVRRDLMLIGFSSDTRKGYDVKVLIEFINNILDSRDVMKLAIIGMGHLGQAITKYFNGKRRKLRIVAAFDVDPEKVGTEIDNIPCYHIDRLADVVSEMDISLAIISSPTSVAPSLVVPIINVGIKGVINFTSAPLNFPQGIVAENYDITTVLEKVAYFVKEADENSDKN
ncbi:MAG: redox-sensing transcriptional repressor Rex [Alistipes sp.]|nr:redox-sensing transcriptional repressor Rex [Alistipes sp.]